MGNCGLKPRVLTEDGAPAPVELGISLLEDQKIDAAKSLSNLFLQDKAEKKTKEDEKKTAPEKIQVAEDLKTVLAKAKSPNKEIKYPATETKTLVTETNAPADDQKVKNEETDLHDEKVIDDVKTESPMQIAKESSALTDDVTVKETDTEAKPEELRRESSSSLKEA